MTDLGRRRKETLSVLAVVTLVWLVTACGSQPTSSEPIDVAAVATRAPVAATDIATDSTRANVTDSSVGDASADDFEASTTITESAAPSTPPQRAEDFVGLVWYWDALGSSLGLEKGVIASGGILSLGDGDHPALGAIDVWFDGVGERGFQPGKHVVAFGIRQRVTEPSGWLVTDAVDVTLGSAEMLSLQHIGCSVDGTYNESVVAVIGPPSVDGGADLAADVWPARQAWRYSSGGLEELDAERVSCELAGEPA